MAWYLKRVLQLLLIYSLSNCGEKIDRDSMNLPSYKIDQLSNKIDTIALLFTKLTSNPDTFGINYCLNNHFNLMLNNIKYGDINTLDYDSILIFHNLTNSEFKSLIGSIKYLKDNNVNCGYYDKAITNWIFGFHELKSTNVATDRFIVKVQNSSDTVKILKYFRIVESKGELLLLKPIIFQ